MGQYLPIVALVVLTALFAVVSIFVSRLLNKPRPTSAKNAPYECGIVDQVDAPQRFGVRFYLVAMIFIIFDIEIIFLFPYATVAERLGGFGLLAVVEFAVAVFGSFVYLISHGALDWGPAKVDGRGALSVDPSRTMTSTVRKVGLEGRHGRPTDHEAA